MGMFKNPNMVIAEAKLHPTGSFLAFFKEKSHENGVVEYINRVTAQSAQALHAHKGSKLQPPMKPLSFVATKPVMNRLRLILAKKKRVILDVSVKY